MPSTAATAEEKRDQGVLGANLRACRERLALPRWRVSSYAGIDTQALRRLEEGSVVRINAAVLLKLAAVLQTTPNALLGVEP